jgi:hydrogenase expression/formation protein HypD
MNTAPGTGDAAGGTSSAARALLPHTAERPLRIMEVCGGHTHAIFKFGLDQLLPENIEFIHGPGCPVCVLPMGRIDACIEIASRPG